MVILVRSSNKYIFFISLNNGHPIAYSTSGAVQDKILVISLKPHSSKSKVFICVHLIVYPFIVFLLRLLLLWPYNLVAKFVIDYGSRLLSQDRLK
ncbi:hypothetical protein Lalb_Chr19g0137911 [Lupinus albus]|uniref:Uncharacterized protein n=1 Tax=Lupinus albus TaxID=3870 RepID=A0A6A4NVD3_LUPAL|nr:hypothetical protein Lalb_Chr19g0137911 [Lupinus albus]